ncbi:MAG: helix-turn-helix transcriptional regulator [Victivallaceae bacterium]
MDDKQHFGNYLKILLRKYKVRHAELADALSVSRQYVSSIITGRKTPSRNCSDAIFYFLDKYLTPQEKQNLANKLIYVKTGINNSLKKLMDTGTTVDEQILLEDFRNLTPKNKIEVIRFVRQKEIEELYKKSKNSKELDTV